MFSFYIALFNFLSLQVSRTGESRLQAYVLCFDLDKKTQAVLTLSSKVHRIKNKEF